MSGGTSPESWEKELKAIRAELASFRQEQKEMAEAINQLLTTFRALATHLGISTEPYGRRGSSASSRDPPGFA